MPAPGTIETPFFLAAMPQVLDPFFHRSVVLMLEYEPNGSFGFIINRPTELTLQEMLESVDLVWSGSPAAKTFFGGPVQPSLGNFVFDAPIPSSADDVLVVDVCDGLRLSQDLRVLGTIAPDPPDRFRLFLGYAGWSPEQLDQEIERNDWLIAPFDAGIVFMSDPDTIWDRVIESIGVRPESLPTWTMPDEPEQTN